ncbi:unnamed protein product [Didymodactylos carnosus]|uniref:Ig-like domain-containing protein n=1 Tax=Didymodactylos carnosus TaxID=1234261 RepID=A0A814PWR6_9BILA|nr:unnamed protein product [Didymodactylos carnosus]CAF3875767.1 unnamed protein product [Didymodactylos carnosus]
MLLQQCTHGLMVNASTSPQIISPPSEIIAYINHTARLSCIIQNKESHHVFWSRYTIVNDTYKLSDVLFINLLKFSSYPHYHLTRKVDKTTEHWNLEIRNIQPLDEGYYGCALSTSEPIIKYSFVRVLGKIE